jgi:hypothetical protein
MGIHPISQQNGRRDLMIHLDITSFTPPFHQSISQQNGCHQAKLAMRGRVHVTIQHVSLIVSRPNGIITSLSFHPSLRAPHIHKNNQTNEPTNQNTKTPKNLSMNTLHKS